MAKKLTTKQVGQMLLGKLGESIERNVYGKMNAKIRKVVKKRHSNFNLLALMGVDVPVPRESPTPKKPLSPKLKQLREMTNAGEKACRHALRANGDDVDRALRALAVSGKLETQGLDPDLVPDVIYALVSIKAMLKGQEAVPAKQRKLFGMSEERLNEFRRQLAGTSEIPDLIMQAAAISRKNYLVLLHPELKQKPVKPKVIRVKPFPPLTRGEGTDTFRSWKG